MNKNRYLPIAFKVSDINNYLINKINIDGYLWFSGEDLHQMSSTQEDNRTIITSQNHNLKKDDIIYLYLYDNTQFHVEDIINPDQFYLKEKIDVPFVINYWYNDFYKNIGSFIFYQTSKTDPIFSHQNFNWNIHPFEKDRIWYPYMHDFYLRDNQLLFIISNMPKNQSPIYWLIFLNNATDVENGKNIITKFIIDMERITTYNLDYYDVIKYVNNYIELLSVHGIHLIFNNDYDIILLMMNTICKGIEMNKNFINGTFQSTMSSILTFNDMIENGKNLSKLPMTGYFNSTSQFYYSHDGLLIEPDKNVYAMILLKYDNIWVTHPEPKNWYPSLDELMAEYKNLIIFNIFGAWLIQKSPSSLSSDKNNIYKLFKKLQTNIELMNDSFNDLLDDKINMLDYLNLIKFEKWRKKINKYNTQINLINSDFIVTPSLT
jgi:hypothetical protein